jgi:hypothetical protein
MAFQGKKKVWMCREASLLACPVACCYNHAHDSSGRRRIFWLYENLETSLEWACFIQLKVIRSEHYTVTDFLNLYKHGPARNCRWGHVFYVVRSTPSAGNRPMNSQSDTWHVFPVWSAPSNNRGAVFCALWNSGIRDQRLRQQQAKMNAGTRGQLLLKTQRTSEEFESKAPGLEFVKRATGISSGLRTLWRLRTPRKRKKNILTVSA